MTRTTLRREAKKALSGFVWRCCGPRTARKIALTFDDGPREGLTDVVLDTLRARGCTATFFMVGERVTAAAQLVRAVRDQGSEIGNHSYTHPFFSQITTKEISQEIQRTDEVIRSVTGITPAYFRPPYGEMSLRLLRYLYSSNRSLPLLWSAATRGYEYDRTSEQIVSDLVDCGLEPGDILLLHDGHARTVHALPEILGLCEERRLQCVTVRELLAGT